MRTLRTNFARGIAAALLCCVATVCGAQNWRQIGPEGGEVISLTSGEKGEVFLGTADGHLFVSRDAGEHWELRGRVGRRMDSVVQALVVDERMKATLYAGVWTQDPLVGGGVYRSEDDGAGWKAAGLEGEAVRALAQSASHPEILVAGTKSGVFETRDTGKTWMRISPVGDEELRNLDSIAIDPRDANVIYAGTYHLPWKTIDGGKNWKAIAAGMIDDSDVMSMAIDWSNPEQLFASACSGIYRSGNGGGQWTKLQGIPYTSRRTQQILQDPVNAAVWYAGTTEGLWKTGDAGENWTRVTARDVVVNAMALPAGTGELLIGTEAGGVWMSRDGGSSLTAKNAGFSHRVLSGLVAGEKEHLVMAIGGGNEELLESTDAGKSWKSMPGVRAEVVALFSAGGEWFAGLRGGGAARYESAAKEWLPLRFVVRSEVSGARKKSSSRNARVAERSVTPEVVALDVAGGRMFAATEDGLWSGGLREGKLQPLAVKELAGKVAFVSAIEEGTEVFVARKNAIARSLDAGKNWEYATLPEKTGDALWVRPENNESSSLVVGAEGGVFKFDWGTTGWRLLQSGLPAAASRPGWIGSDLWAVPMRAGGVYISRDAGRNWERAGEEVDGAVTVVSEGQGRILVGTRTDGVFLWERAEPQNGTTASSDSIHN